MVLIGIVTFIILTALITALIVFSKKVRLSGKTASSIVKGTAVAGVIAIALMSVAVVSFSANKLYAQDAGQTQVKAPDSGAKGFGFIAAGLAVGLGVIGTGIAVGMSAAAAIGAISENPKMFGNALVFVGLAEGLGIYGLVIAIMILSK